MLSSEWVLAGFVATLLIAPRRQHANALLLAAALTLPLHLLPSGGWNMTCCQKVRALEDHGIGQLAAKDYDGLFETIKSIQKVDRGNAMAQFFGGKIAEASGADARPIMMEAARRGSGFAQAWLCTEKGQPCCNANGGTTVLAGN